MKLAKGPRPWAIHTFAIILVVLGIIGLGASFFEIEESLEVLQQDLPMIEWTRDYVIVSNFSLFTILLIPVIAVWCFASRIARLIVAVMCVLPILALGSALYFGLADDDLFFGLVVPEDKIPRPDS